MEVQLRRGETLRIYLDDPDGIGEQVTAIAADLREGSGWPGPRCHTASPVAATFVVEPREAEGERPAGWTLELDAEQTIGLPIRTLVIDARLSLAGGDVVLTDLVAVRVVEPATVRDA